MVDAGSIIQETPAALHVPGVQVGLIVAVTTKGDVGVNYRTAVRST